jgi:S1-C subfamily serine protease
MPLAQLTVLSTEKEAVVYSLTEQTLSVGRSPENTIILSHDSVSSHHAEIVPVDGDYLLRDLQSSNGTAVNGEPITEVNIKDGDRIMFGSVECLFQQKRAGETPPPDPPLSAMDEGVALPNLTFGSKLASLGRAAFNETKRNAQLLALKAKIEKLKHIDLAKAHYALGKKCVELGLFRNAIKSLFDSIDSLKLRANQKRVGTTATAGATTSANLKRSAANLAMKAEAEALELKMKQLFIEVGKEVVTLAQTRHELQHEIRIINQVTASIVAAEAEYTSLSGRTSGSSDLKTLSQSLASESASAANILKSRIRTALHGRLRVTLCIATLLCILAGGLIFKSRYGSAKRADSGAPMFTNSKGTSLDFAKLGETIEQTNERYGSPTSTGLTQKNLRMQTHKFKNSKILVNFDKNKSVVAQYTKIDGSDIGNDELALLLELNAGSSSWNEQKMEKEGQRLWFRADDDAFVCYDKAFEGSTPGVFIANKQWFAADDTDSVRSEQGSISDSQIFRNSIPAIVTVIVGSSSRIEGHGRGFFVAHGGYILTNYHVVKDETRISIVMFDKKMLPATVVGFTQTPDLALLKVDVPDHRVLKLGDSDKVETGGHVCVIGSPLRMNLSPTLNTGTISSVDRRIDRNPVFQIDATINHGNSGGPLLDERGRVIGIITFGFGDFGADRFNFAIKANAAKALLRKHVTGF